MNKTDNEEETTNTPIPKGQYVRAGSRLVIDIEKEEEKEFFRELNRQLRGINR